jgi:predicted glycoside hydrolase/deacetylase ChbG (UPF0249 family)
MKRLIVNADDFGRTDGINRGIVDTHLRGIVSSATAMVNYATASDAARMARDCPRLGVGLHFALTGGTPTLAASEVPSLVDEHGRLPAKPEGLTRARADEVLAEGRAQLARFTELFGRKPTHIDSHHHSHRLPVVFGALVHMAKDAGLPVRCASVEMRDELRRQGLVTTDAFVESFYEEAATLPALIEILDALPDGVSEVMCHPAYVDDELRAGSGYAAPRDREREVLTSAAARRALAERGIELITFAEL